MADPSIMHEDVNRQLRTQIAQLEEDEAKADFSPFNIHQVVYQLQEFRIPHFQRIVTRNLMVNGRNVGGSYKLELPPLFVKEHGDKFQETVILKERHRGREWTVKIRISEWTPYEREKVFFDRGLGRFSKENRLEKGDVLVFSLVAMSKFVVHIFCHDGNNKERGQPKAVSKSVVLQETHLLEGQKTVEKEFEDRDEIILESLVQKEAVEFVEDCSNAVSTVNQPDYELIQDAVFTKNEVIFARFTKNVYDQTIERQVIRLIEGFQCPHFVKTLRPTNMRNEKSARLNVPAEFSQKYGSYFEGMNNLVQGPNCLVMEVNTIRTNTPGLSTDLHFSGGWRAFFKQNELRLGDVLLFSLPAPAFWIVQVVQKGTPQAEQQT